MRFFVLFFLLFLGLLFVPRFLFAELTAQEPLVFLGDSITAAGRWSEMFPERDVVNMGINGDTTAKVLNRLDSVVALKPRKIFLMIGINDQPCTRTLMGILKNYYFILKKIKKKLPDTAVFIQSVLPVNHEIFHTGIDNDSVVELNDALRKKCRKLGYVYVDLYSSFASKDNELKALYTHDGLHLNLEGYKLWKSLLSKHVL